MECLAAIQRGMTSASGSVTSFPPGAQSISVIVGRRPAAGSAMNEPYYDNDIEHGGSPDADKEEGNIALQESSSGHLESLQGQSNDGNQYQQRLTTSTSGNSSSPMIPTSSGVSLPSSVGSGPPDHVTLRRSTRDRDPRVNRGKAKSSDVNSRSGNLNPGTSAVTGMLEGLDDTISRMRNYLSCSQPTTTTRDVTVMMTSSSGDASSSPSAIRPPLISSSFFSHAVSPVVNTPATAQLASVTSTCSRFGIPLTLVPVDPWTHGVSACPTVGATGSARPILPLPMTVGDFLRPPNGMFTVPPPPLPRAPLMTVVSNPGNHSLGQMVGIRYILASNPVHQLPLSRPVPFHLAPVIQQAVLPPHSINSSPSSTIVHLVTQVDLQRPPPPLLPNIPDVTRVLSTVNALADKPSSPVVEIPPSSVPSVDALPTSTSSMSIVTPASVSSDSNGIPDVPRAAADVALSASSSLSSSSPSSSSSGGSRAAVIFLLRRQQSIISEITRQLSGDLNAIAMFLRQTKPDEINETERTAMTSIHEIASNFRALTPICMTYRLLFEQATVGPTSSTPSESPGTASGLPTTSCLTRHEKLLKRCRESLATIFAQRRDLVMQTVIASQQRLMTFAWLDRNRIKILDCITIVDGVLKETVDALQIPCLPGMSSGATDACSTSILSDVVPVGSDVLSSAPEPASSALPLALTNGSLNAGQSGTSTLPLYETVGVQVDEAADDQPSGRKTRKTTKKRRKKGHQVIDETFSMDSASSIGSTQTSTDVGAEARLIKMENTKLRNLTPKVVRPETIIFDADDISVSLEGNRKRKLTTPLSESENTIKTEEADRPPSSLLSEKDLNATTDQPAQSQFSVDKWFKQISRLRKHFKKMKAAKGTVGTSQTESMSVDEPQSSSLGQTVKCEALTEPRCSSVNLEVNNDQRSRQPTTNGDGIDSAERPPEVTAGMMVSGADDNESAYKNHLHDLLAARDQRAFSRLLIDSVCSMPPEDFQRVREMLLQRLAENRRRGAAGTEESQSATDENVEVAGPPSAGQTENDMSNSCQPLTTLHLTDSSVDRMIYRAGGEGHPSPLHLKIKDVWSCDDLSSHERYLIPKTNSFSSETLSTIRDDGIDNDFKCENTCSRDVTANTKRRKRRADIDDVIVVDSSSDEEKSDVILTNSTDTATFNVITIAPLDLDNVNHDDDDGEDSIRDFKDDIEHLRDPCAIIRTRQPTPYYPIPVITKPVIGTVTYVHDNNTTSSSLVSGPLSELRPSIASPPQCSTDVAGTRRHANIHCSYQAALSSSASNASSHQMPLLAGSIAAATAAANSWQVGLCDELQPKRSRRGLLPTPPPSMLVRADIYSNLDATRRDAEDSRTTTNVTSRHDTQNNSSTQLDLNGNRVPPSTSSPLNVEDSQRSASCLIELNLSMTSLTRYILDSELRRRLASRSPESTRLPSLSHVAMVTGRSPGIDPSTYHTKTSIHGHVTHQSAVIEADTARQMSLLPSMTSSGTQGSWLPGSFADRQHHRTVGAVDVQQHLQRQYPARPRSDSSEMVSPSSTSPGSCFNVNRSRPNFTSGSYRDSYGDERTMLAVRRPDMADINGYDVTQRRYRRAMNFNEGYRRSADQNFFEDDDCREGVIWRGGRGGRDSVSPPVGGPEWPNKHLRHKARCSDFVTISRKTLMEMNRHRMRRPGFHRHAFHQRHGCTTTGRLSTKSRKTSPDRESRCSLSPLNRSISPENRRYKPRDGTASKVRKEPDGSRGKRKNKDASGGEKLRPKGDLSLSTESKVRRTSAEKKVAAERKVGTSGSDQRSARREGSLEICVSGKHVDGGDRPSRRRHRMTDCRGSAEIHCKWDNSERSPINSDRSRQGSSASSSESEFVKRRRDCSRSHSKSSMGSNSKNGNSLTECRRRRRSSSPMSAKLIDDDDKKRTLPSAADKMSKSAKYEQRTDRRSGRMKVFPNSGDDLAKRLGHSGANGDTRNAIGNDVTDRKSKGECPDVVGQHYDSNCNVLAPTDGRVTCGTSGLNLVSRSYTSPMGSDWSDTEDIPDSDSVSNGASSVAFEMTSTRDDQGPPSTRVA